MIDDRLICQHGEHSILSEEDFAFTFSPADLRLTVVTKVSGNGTVPAWSPTEINRVRLLLGTTEVYTHPDVPDAFVMLGRFEARQIARAVGNLAFSATEVIGAENSDLPFSILDPLTREDDGDD